MNTTELKKLVEAATPGPWIAAGPSFGGEFPVYCEEVVVDREHDNDDGYGICQAPTGLEKESTHDMSYIAAANPAAILKLLAINAELVEALNEAATSLETINRLAGKASYGVDEDGPIPTYMGHHDEVRAYAGSRAGCARAALAKAEGGEL